MHNPEYLKDPKKIAEMEDAKEFIESCPDAENYFIVLQDKRRKDSDTISTKYAVNKEMYHYYFIHFIRLWGNKINFESLDGTTANGFLDALKTK